MARLMKLDMRLIEGHARVIIPVSDNGRLAGRVMYQGIDTRFFERLWIGLCPGELPRITPMICGVCSASHHVCSAFATDGVYGVEAPEVAVKIRGLINLGILLNNMALHLVAMGLPDFLPERPRSVFKLVSRNPRLAEEGFKLMSLGHEVVRVFGGRSIHPVNAVPGGVARLPSRDEIEKLRELFEKHIDGLKLFVEEALRFLSEAKSRISVYENGVEYMMAVVGDKGLFTPVTGKLRVIDSKGSTVAEFKAEEYQRFFEEVVMDYTYIKMPVLKTVGYPRGAIRVGPLARLNVVEGYGVEEADELRDKLFEEWGKPATHPLLSHYARVVETIAFYELTRRSLNDPSLTEGKARIPVGEGNGESVAAVEAPRGTLIHHYRGERDKTTFVNVITPTAFNAPAIENDLTRFFEARSITSMSDEEVYDHVSAVVRAYDPCMSCATHATGSKPLEILIVSLDGRLARRVG